MANQTPLNITTDGAGGYLFEEKYGDLLIDQIQRATAAANACRVDRLSGKRQKYTVYAGRPTVSVVAESGEKPVTGAEFTQLTLNPVKLATTVIYTEELLEDADTDPRSLINADLAEAFAYEIDAQILGMRNGSAIVSSMDSEMTASTNTVTDLGTTGDAVALAVSNAMEAVEANGYNPTDIILARDLKASIRNARMAAETATPLYSPGFQREPDSLYGLPIRWTSNLDALPAGAGKIAGLVVDRAHMILGLRKDLRMKVSDQATLNIGGTPRNLWQRNEVAVLWEMRAGFVAHDLNKAVAVIPNAS